MAATAWPKHLVGAEAFAHSCYKANKKATRRWLFGAGDEVRTRDLDLGKVALYQLSYSRLRYFAAVAANGGTKVGKRACEASRRPKKNELQGLFASFSSLKIFIALNKTH